MENTNVDGLFDGSPVPGLTTAPPATSLRILKFMFRIEDLAVIKMPVGARILKVDAQRNIPCVWVLGNPDFRYCERGLQIVGTGNPLPMDLGEYVCTFMMNGDALVWHVFDAGETS